LFKSVHIYAQLKLHLPMLTVAVAEALLKNVGLVLVTVACT